MNIFADEGYIFICLACGKRSNDLYGTDPIDKGWDESCMINAAMILKYDLKPKD